MIVWTHIYQQNNQSTHNTVLGWSEKPTCFSCVKQPSLGFIFQKYIKKKLYSYSHTFDNKTYGWESHLQNIFIISKSAVKYY
jgi:hypothetical protein